jgi:release factor glutamine methyltransferase
MAVNAFLFETAQRLQNISDTPELDSQVLLAHILDRPRSWLLAHPEADLSPLQQATLIEALYRLERGEPLPYVLRHREFFGLDFIVTPDVLIPRPETELLVEHALEWLQEHPDRQSVVDVGTGSGCIAVSLACHVQNLQLLATDISPAALEVAQKNAHQHGVSDRISFSCCDLLPLENETGSIQHHPSSVVRCPFFIVRQPAVDLICANLPYIPTSTLQSLPIYGHEPSLALDGGPDGLDPICRLLGMLPKAIASGGLCLLEIEASQGQAVLAIVEKSFPAAKVTLYQDLAGKDRLIGIEF